ncbi:MAG: class I SAM-dependent methyltransferase [Deltaproteobacteria bacterium]|jgi:SAM-dependent methyltransferase
MALFEGLFSKTQPSSLNRWQEAFIRWNAARLDITEEESRQRYLASAAAAEGGHAGREFRKHCETAHEVFRVLWSDTQHEVLDAYRFHAPMHFLRMIAYTEATWADDDPIVQAIDRNSDDFTIVDYGCGLAQKSINLARRHPDRAHLFLVDIPTIRREFLAWYAADLGIPCEFGDVSEDHPIPELPQHDVCIAEQVFEHIYNPGEVFEVIHAALRPGGYLQTNVADHKEEFMHVTPKLEALRERIRALGYEALVPDRLFRKPQ